MFGKTNERIAYEYLMAEVNQQESLKRTLLKTPIKSTVSLVILGAVVLRRFGNANLTTPYRQAPPHIYQKVMVYHEKIVSDVANFAATVGDEGLLQICDALTAADIQIAVFAAFVLTYNSGYSYEVLQKIDESLHNLNGTLPTRFKEMLASLICIIQAQEGVEQSVALMQREAYRKGVELRVIGNSIMAEALNFLLPYETHVPKQEPARTDDESAAKWTHYWNWVDPDNAPWNYDYDN